jgi:AsmA protein
MLEGVSAQRIGTVVAVAVCLAFIVGVPAAINLGFVPRHVSSGLAVQAGGSDAVLIRTPVRLSNTPDIVLEAGSVFDADAAAGRRSAKTTIATIIVDAPLITVAASPDMQLSIGPEEETVPEFLPAIVDQLAALAFDKLIVRKGTVVVASNDARNSTFSDVTAEITSNRKGTYAAKGSASFRGSVINYEASWSLPAPGRKLSLRVPLKLTVTSPALEASVDGKLAVTDGLRLYGSADVSVRRLRELAKWFGIDDASVLDLQDLRIKSSLDWGAGTLTFSRATVSVDGNEGAGALALATSSPVPAIDATLAFQKLDLTRYSPVASLWPAVWSAAGESGASLTSLDVDLRMSAAKVMLPYVQTGRGAVTIALKNGRLLADVAELELEGGSFSGQMNADFTGSVPRYSVRGKLENVDAGRCVSELLHRNPLQGRANILLDLVGSGGAAADVLSSLSGKVNFNLNEGGRLGLDLRALRYAVQRGVAKGWSAAGKGQTALEQLDARLSLHTGVVFAEQLQAKGGGLTINGSGSINMPQRLLDVTLQFGNAGGERPGIGGDAVVLSGPWNDPVISADRLPSHASAPGQ